MLYYLDDCGAEEFQCHDGLCLSIDKRCNGKLECSTGEDEANCNIPVDGSGTGTLNLLLVFIFLCEVSN